MKIIENYADLIRKINIIKVQIEMFEVEMDYWLGENIPFESKGTVKFGIDTSVNQMDRIVSKLEELKYMLEFYESVKKDMDTYINKLEGLQYKIAYLRFVENMTYKEIAEKLGYSYGYIRNVVYETNLINDKALNS